MRLLLAPLAGALALLLAGCTDGSGATPQPTTTLSPVGLPSASERPCPTVSPGNPKWPADVPDDLPLPKQARITKSERTEGNLFVVQFTVPWSLRQSVTYLVEEYPQVGYVLGRGDAEIAEADAPFSRGPLQGLLRIFATAECETLWVLALGQSGGAVPFNPTFSPRASSSPLPFG